MFSLSQKQDQEYPFLYFHRHYIFRYSIGGNTGMGGDDIVSVLFPKIFVNVQPKPRYMAEQDCMQVHRAAKAWRMAQQQQRHAAV